MTRISGDWLTRPGTAALFDAIEGAGRRAYFVGGCVRDALGGRAVGDIDLSTDALPSDVVRLAEAAGLKAVPTGIDHGTVTVVADDVAHEVTTFRRDVETDGRRAVVAFSDAMEDDARRRDFTINALYARRDGAVMDPLGEGIADLQAGRVRFVGDAVDRIREDYLRILRYFRFLARFGTAGTDPDALDAIARTLHGLAGLSAERVGHEILKLLGADDPAPAVQAMTHAGVLARVLPGAVASPLAVLVHLETAQGVPANPIRRLAALGGGDPTDRLRLSRADARRLALLRERMGDGTSPAEIGYRDGFETARDTVLLRAASLGTPVPDDALAEAQRGAGAEFPLAAADLMPRFEGPALGRALRDREARWIASGFALTRDDLIRD